MLFASWEEEFNKLDYLLMTLSKDPSSFVLDQIQQTIKNIMRDIVMRKDWKVNVQTCVLCYIATQFGGRRNLCNSPSHSQKWLLLSPVDQDSSVWTPDSSADCLSVPACLYNASCYQPVPDTTLSSAGALSLSGDSQRRPCAASGVSGSLDKWKSFESNINEL